MLESIRKLIEAAEDMIIIGNSAFIFLGEIEEFLRIVKNMNPKIHLKIEFWDNSTTKVSVIK